MFLELFQFAAGKCKPKKDLRSVSCLIFVNFLSGRRFQKIQVKSLCNLFLWILLPGGCKKEIQMVEFLTFNPEVVTLMRKS